MIIQFKGIITLREQKEKKFLRLALEQVIHDYGWPEDLEKLEVDEIEIDPETKNA